MRRSILQEKEEATFEHPAPFWKRHWRSILMVLLGLLLGWGGRGIVSGGSDSHEGHQHTKSVSKKKKKPEVWTCSMHPQIKLPKKGKCPICFMDLIKLEEGEGSDSPRELSFSKTALALANIGTTKVIRRPVSRKLHMTGKVTYDETRMKTITSWIPGRLERLFVDYTGVPVRKGDHLVRMYSPELLTAQQELVQASRAVKRARKEGKKGFALRLARQSLHSSKKKLELLGLRRWQIRKIERSGKASTRVNIYAPLGGIVVEKKVTEGMYVKTGTPVYTIADLSKVWVVFDAYERDLPWLQEGQAVSFHTVAEPGRKYEGKIIYIDPVLNPNTRTVRVRVNVSNKDKSLKPDMFVSGSVHVALNAEGRVRRILHKKRWTCPMHPEIVRKRKGSCSLCGMPLVYRHPKKSSSLDLLDPLVIPDSAPLITGRRAVVYVKKKGVKKPTFEGREITLGTHASPYYVVLKGLKENEEVVSHGAFKLDSELQIRAKPNMMTIQEKNQEVQRVKSERRKVSQAFSKLQRRVYHRYFELQEALAADKLKLSQKAYRRLFRLFRKPRILAGKESALWDGLRTKLHPVLKKASRLQDWGTLRLLFNDVSSQLILFEKYLGHPGIQPIFLSYCPMAFNNKGAYWLQRSKLINNPYFGAKMLRCGETKKTFAGRDAKPVKMSRRFLKKVKPLYQAYFALQHSLFKDQEKESYQNLLRLARVTRRLKSLKVSSSYRMKWKWLMSPLHKSLLKARTTKKIKAIRKVFFPISKSFLQLSHIFGHVGSFSVYETYCPMAFNNTGASWLQPQDKEVRNPYFGAKMAHCGNIKRKMASRFPVRVQRRKRKGAKK